MFDNRKYKYIVQQVFLCLLLLNPLFTWAQDPPCLSGWEYRTPVIIDNGLNSETLTDYQVSIEVNTQDLIANSKAQISGGDIRFLDKDGVVLPFWVENDTYNTSATKFWVKVPELLANQKDTIYLFYGQLTASSIADGASTFELFDDFLGASIDPSKWEECTESPVSISGGVATFSSTLTDRSTIKSISSLNSPVIVEQYLVEEAAVGLGYLGLINSANNGYAMTFEYNLQPTMRLLRLEDDVDCLKLTDVHSSQSAARSATVTEGIWSFSWHDTNEQSFDWPSASSTEVRNDTQFPFPSDVKVAIGNIDSVGSIKVDWVRARKYTANEPTTSLGVEVAEITSIDVSSNGPVCENDELLLYANAVTGASYSWSGPGGFTSALQNPIVSNSSLSQTGYFKVEATITGGCSSVSDSVYVEINALTQAGDLNGHDIICAGANTGIVDLVNYTGSVQRWETSSTGLAPWSSIAETNDTIVYNDLVNTTYYRAIVKNGVCLEEASDSVQLVVDMNTVAGVVLGENEVCAFDNDGDVTLNSFVGEVINWRFLEEGTTNWVDVVGTETLYSYDDLTTTTYYRAVVQNGVCATLLSDSVKITVNPLPTVDFNAPTVCNGNSTVFENLTTVTTGSLRNYTWDFSDGSNSIGENPQHDFDSEGTYSVKLRVETNEFCLAEIEKDVTVHPLPQVDFFHTDVCQKNELPVIQNVFIPSGGINEFIWDFGDNVGSSVLPLDSYLYDTSGVYSVKLIAISSENCKDSITREVTVYPLAVLEFEVEDVFLGETSTFVNNSTIEAGNLTYHWFFQDGQASFLENPTHNYAAAGDYDVELISTSSLGGCNDTVSVTHTVNDQTKAEFSVDNTCLYDSAQFLNESFIFSGSLTYAWDFGDGNTSIEEHPAHLYENPGTYLVKLTATSDLGSTNEFTLLLTVYPLPTSSFVMNNVCDEENVVFSNLSSISGGTLTYQWSFGDGNTLDEFQPEHRYATDSTYTVELVSTSNYNCTDTSNAEVIVYPLPETFFTVEAVCDGFPSLFNDSTSVSSGSIVSYAWSFGDGTNSIEQNPEKQFLNPDSYYVQLTTVSDQACSKGYAEIVQVITSPVADFSVDNQCFQDNVAPLNLSQSDEGDLTYAWSFGDGSVSTLSNTTHQYTYPGSYALKLIATSSYGCVDSLLSLVEIYSLPTIEAGEDVTVSQGYSVTLSATGGESYIWSSGESLDNQGIANPVATPFETTEFIVTSTDENGCTGVAYQTVFVEEDFKLEPSNIITPNGNNENDTWYVKNITSFTDCTVLVFDRWGKKVFEQENYQNDWAGTSGTDVLPDGEYYYIITSDSSEQVYKGAITILRN